mmetsp:Transcript_20534/g.53388  ORF Transcript_20534/g.53388 Transcript_20534/m.53388 type:complete len:227 (+) Transcript_20534:503-1183(+)
MDGGPAKNLNPLHLTLGLSLGGVEVVLELHLDALVGVVFCRHLGICPPASHPLNEELPFLVALILQNHRGRAHPDCTHRVRCRKRALGLAKALASKALQLLGHIEEGHAVLLRTVLRKVVGNVVIHHDPALLDVGNHLNVDEVERNGVLVEDGRERLVPERCSEHDLVVRSRSAEGDERRLEVLHAADRHLPGRIFHKVERKVVRKVWIHPDELDYRLEHVFSLVG